MSTPEEVAAELAAEAAARPDYLLERFKTPEDQARAYGEAEKEMNRLRAQSDRERAEFAAAVEQMSAMQEQAQVPQGLNPQTNQVLAQLQFARESGDFATELAMTLALNKQMFDESLDERFKKLSPQLDDQRQADRDIAFRIAEDRVQRVYGEEQWGEIQPAVNEWLNTHPAYLPQVNDPVAFETVIREAATIVVNEQAAKQLAQIESDRQSKLVAQTATGTGQGRYPTQTDEKAKAWQAVVDAPVSSYSQLRSGS